jgi:hypothetical protein
LGIFTRGLEVILKLSETLGAAHDSASIGTECNPAPIVLAKLGDWKLRANPLKIPQVHRIAP